MEDDSVDVSLILPSGSKRMRLPPTRYQDPDYAKLMMAENEREELEAIDSDDDVAQELEDDESESDESDASYDSDFVEKEGEEGPPEGEDPDYDEEDEEEDDDEDEEEDEEEDDEEDEEKDEEEDEEDEESKAPPTPDAQNKTPAPIRTPASKRRHNLK